MHGRPLLRAPARLLDVLCGRRCPGCGQPSSTQPCPSCSLALRTHPAGAGAVWHDHGVPARLVRRAKLGYWRGGRLLAGAVADRRARPDVDLITWVPADRRRRARRGGCLPETVARELGRRWNVPVDELLRRVGGASQRGLGRRERRANVADAYRLAAEPAAMRPRVLVLDDVRTTGATLEAVARCLAPACARVQLLALVGVDREPDRALVRIPGTAGVARSAGVSRGIPATSAEIPLTIGGTGADTVEHLQ